MPQAGGERWIDGRGYERYDPHQLVPAPLAHLAAAILVSAAPEAPADGAPGWISPQAIVHYVESRLAFKSGDLQRALAELERALVFDERSAALRVAHAEVLFAAGAIPRATAQLRRALEIEADGPSAARARVLAGGIAASSRQWDRAALEFREAMRLEAELARREGRPPEPGPARALATILSQTGDDAGAAAVLDELARELPAAAAAGYRELASDAHEAHDAARAERHLRTAATLAPRDGAAWRTLARLEASRGRDDEARVAWEAAVRADPDDVDALQALGSAALKARDHAAARAWFRQLVAADSDPDAARTTVAFAWLDAGEPREALSALGPESRDPDPRISLVRGLALQDLRRWDDAARAFERVPADGGELDGLARPRQAWCLARAGRSAEALALLERARAARPGDQRLLTTTSQVLSESGRHADAVAVLEGALADRRWSGEESSAIAEALGAVLVAAGRAADAVVLLERAVADRPRDPALLFALASAHERAGDLEAGLTRMGALLALDPNHADALNFVAYAYAERGVRLDEAEHMLRRALELRPENPYFLDSLGWVYFRKGEYVRAVQALERADSAAGPDPTILEHLGDAYHGAGRDRDAATAYRRAIEALRVGPPPPRSEDERSAALERKIRELPAR